MKTECKVCTVMCDILSGNELRTCAFEHKSICPFDARYLDLSEHDKQVRADAIEEVIKIADCSHTDCWDCAFADADLCKLQMLYKDWNS